MLFIFIFIPNPIPLLEAGALFAIFILGGGAMLNVLDPAGLRGGGAMLKDENGLLWF